MPETAPGFSGLSVLAVIAHPDDEAFGCGGTLAMLVARGARITLLCATDGDVGEISDPTLATPDTLAQVRREELRRASAVNGVQDLRFLGYRDSGMDGTEDNQHPDCLFQAPSDRVASQLVELIREVRPQVVVTHDPTGGYGHPDHITVSRDVTRAFALTGDAGNISQYAPRGEPWAPELLYYMCIPRSSFRRMWQHMLDNGIKPPFASEAVDVLGTPDEDVTTVVDISAFVEIKLESLSRHQTQIDANGPIAQLPPEILREFMSTEYYSLVPSDDGQDQVDLLAGLK